METKMKNEKKRKKKILNKLLKLEEIDFFSSFHKFLFLKKFPCRKKLNFLETLRT
jgi:hypothetical protein